MLKSVIHAIFMCPGSSCWDRSIAAEVLRQLPIPDPGKWLDWLERRSLGDPSDDSLMAQAGPKAMMLRYAPGFLLTNGLVPISIGNIAIGVDLLCAANAGIDLGTGMALELFLAGRDSVGPSGSRFAELAREVADRVPVARVMAGDSSCLAAVLRAGVPPDRVLWPLTFWEAATYADAVDGVPVFSSGRTARGSFVQVFQDIRTGQHDTFKEAAARLGLTAAWDLFPTD